MENIKSSLGPAEDTAKKQRGRPFEPGTSGNPNGRPKGSRNKTTVAIEALLDGEFGSDHPQASREGEGRRHDRSAALSRTAVAAST